MLGISLIAINLKQSANFIGGCVLDQAIR